MKELMKERRWCVFNNEKQPFVGQRMGGQNNPGCWLSYEEASRLVEEHSDLFKWKGFFISKRENNPLYALCIIDVDAHKQDENPLAEEILRLFSGTYIERSPSGKGYHIICNVELEKVPFDENGERQFKITDGKQELELYIGEITKKGLTYTGDVYSETQEITDQTEQVLEFIRRYMSDYETVRTKKLKEERHYDIPPVDNDYIAERLNIARRSQYGERFVKLYDKGDISDFHDDHSRADMYLTKRLCFWLGPYEELIDKAFRSSQLFRDKWDERHGKETYGETTIRKAIDDSEKYYEPPCSDQFYSLNWSGILPEENVDSALETPDTTVYRKPITPKKILHLINEAQEDLSTQDKISVFNLPCGTGKSSAIRLKIRQVIEANNGDGLIVITDSLDRMRDYVQPKDPELLEFFTKYANQITIMTHDNYDEVKYTQRSCPVLIMATQRFICLTKERIEDFIRWEHGNRSLIIVDEKPSFLKNIEFTEEQVKTVASAINMGIPSGDPDKKEMYDFWNYTLSHYFTEATHGMLDAFATTKQKYIFWKAPWFEEDLFERQFSLARKHTNELNTYRNKGDYVDIYSIVRAVQQLLYSGALIGFRKTRNDTIKYSFSALLSNIRNYTDISAKVIIMDGTADLSVEYEIFADCLDIRPCEEYKRDLSKLYINILRASTGKTTLETNSALREEITAKTNIYQNQIRQQTGKQPVIFSYKFLKKAFSAFCDEKHFDWFGNIRGKNDYRKVKNIIQVGLNVFPPEVYFLYELWKDPKLLYQLQHMKREDTIPVIQQHIDAEEGFTKKATISEQLAELEQNIFRGTIRNSNNNNDFTFHLIVSQSHEDLIGAIDDRFEKLNAKVEPKVFQVRERNDNEGSIFQRAAHWHDTVLDEGDEYTTADMAAGIGVRREAITDAAKPKSNKQFARLLHNEIKVEGKHGRTAIYVKKSNWMAN